MGPRAPSPALAALGLALLGACGGPPPATIEVGAAAPAADIPEGAPPRPRAAARPSAAPRTTPPPSAEQSVEARAQALFEEARLLMVKADFPAACARFAECQALSPALGTLLNLANCEELMGDRAAACRHFREAADMAQATGQAAREKLARDRLLRLGCP